MGLGGGGTFALYFAWRRQRSTEETLAHQQQVAVATEADAVERRITDLYTKAVEQLGSEKAPVRLGAARFNGARFGQSVWFDDATFEQMAWFGDVTFKLRTSFLNARFAGPARFGGATFTAWAKPGSPEARIPSCSIS